MKLYEIWAGYRNPDAFSADKQLPRHLSVAKGTMLWINNLLKNPAVKYRGEITNKPVDRSHRLDLFEFGSIQVQVESIRSSNPPIALTFSMYGTFDDMLQVANMIESVGGRVHNADYRSPPAAELDKAMKKGKRK